MKSLNNQNGLTLIEVVMGLAISAVILALLLGAIRLGQRSQEKGMERQELSQRIRIIHDRLGWLVRGAYSYIYVDPEEPDEPELFFNGTKSSLGFVTTATDTYSDSPQDMSGLKYVNISVGEGGLVIAEQIFYLGGDDIPDENRYVLEPGVSKLSFSYLNPNIDEEGEAGSPDWVDQWDGTSTPYLPLAVRIDIELRQGEQEISLPPVIAAVRASHGEDTDQPASGISQGMQKQPSR